MTTQIQAQLYLSDQRGCTETAYARSFHTLNFGHYFDEYRKPVNSLTALNDDTLAAGYSLNRQVDQQMNVVVIPVVGGLEFDSSVGHGFVPSGQAQIFSLAPGMELTIYNPYTTEVINFIQIWIADLSTHAKPACQSVEFDLSNKNTLLPFFTLATKSDNKLTTKGFIGKYDGRQDGLYKSTATDDQQPTSIFVFVLRGAFEVQNRLLQTGDGLALPTTGNQPIDFEALSNDALFLLLDIP
ncbi:pirin family protein [Spirosoma lituiforme]